MLRATIPYNLHMLKDVKAVQGSMRSGKSLCHKRVRKKYQASWQHTARMGHIGGLV